MPILNFSNPNNLDFMQKLATRILAECHGMKFDEVLERLTASLPPSKILEKVEKVWIEDVQEKNEIIEGLKPCTIKKIEKN